MLCPQGKEVKDLVTPEQGVHHKISPHQRQRETRKNEKKMKRKDIGAQDHTYCVRSPLLVDI